MMLHLVRITAWLIPTYLAAKVLGLPANWQLLLFIYVADWIASLVQRMLPYRGRKS